LGHLIFYTKNVEKRVDKSEIIVYNQDNEQMFGR